MTEEQWTGAWYAAFVLAAIFAVFSCGAGWQAHVDDRLLVRLGHGDLVSLLRQWR